MSQDGACHSLFRPGRASAELSCLGVGVAHSLLAGPVRTSCDLSGESSGASSLRDGACGGTHGPGGAADKVGFCLLACGYEATLNQAAEIPSVLGRRLLVPMRTDRQTRTDRPQCPYISISLQRKVAQKKLRNRRQHQLPMSIATPERHTCARRCSSNSCHHLHLSPPSPPTA